MSSLIRRWELRIKRSKGLIPPRNKAINRFKGIPYRNGYFVGKGENKKFIRYH